MLIEEFLGSIGSGLIDISRWFREIICSRSLESSDCYVIVSKFWPECRTADAKLVCWFFWLIPLSLSGLISGCPLIFGSVLIVLGEGSTSKNLNWGLSI
jgi:hypothetical protein